MKKIYFLLTIVITNNLILQAQPVKNYPTPEFNNEIYLLKKDSMELVRLEKNYSKASMKTKMGGMGGGENSYAIDGAKSPVVFGDGNSLSFIFYSGSGSEHSQNASDSMLRANGIDASGFGEAMSMQTDPASTISLYKMNVEKGSRKITLQSFQGMKILGKATKESTKYTLSTKKIRQGYYEMVVDKPLPRGEYAFLINSMQTDGAMLLFSFRVD